MKLSRIYSETRKGPQLHSKDYQPTSLEDVEREVRGLNGEDKTLVMFMLNETSNLSIGGGPIHFNVEVTVGITDAFFTLSNGKAIENDSEEQETELVVGGQLVSYPSRHIVDIKTAIKAAQYWSEHGGLDPTLIWDEH